MIPESEPVFPQTLNIETTNRCNLKCVMCPREKMTRAEGTMDMDLYRKIVADCSGYVEHIKKFMPFMDGEPLLDNLLEERIRIAKDAGIKIVEVATNGMLLDDSRARSLIKSGLDSMIISLEDIDKDVHERIRRGCDYNRVISNLQSFISVRDQAGSAAPRITVRMLGFQENTARREAFLHDWSTIVENVTVQPLHNWGGAVSFGEQRSHPNTQCRYLWNNMVILVDGTVALCCLDYDGVHKMGNVRDESIHDIWHGEKFREYRAMFQKRQIDLCNNCNWIPGSEIMHVAKDDVVSDNKEGSERKADLEWTGERFLPWIQGAQIHYEHLHRYSLAAQFVKGKKVLDLACGEGYGTHMLAGKAEYAVGVDIDEQTVRHAASRYLRDNLEFIQGSIMDVPIEGAKQFDVVICFEAIEHIPEHDRLLCEVKRLIKDDGLFIVSTPNKAVYTDQRDYHNPFHVKELQAEEFDSLLGQYFKHRRLFGQRVYAGSNMWSIDRPASRGYEETIVGKADTEFCPTDRTSNDAKYLVAIASDADLGPLVAITDSWLTDASDALLGNYEQQVARLNRALQDKTSRVADLASSLKEKTSRVANLAAQVTGLNQHVATLEAQLVAVYSSYSWRITSPVRAAADVFRLGWLMRNTRRAFTLLGWLGTGQFSRAGNALIPYYQRYAPRRIKAMIPSRARRALLRQLNMPQSEMPAQAEKGPRSAPGHIDRATHVSRGTDVIEMSVSMIVLNRDGAELLDQLLASLASTNTRLLREIIIVDHASSDSSRDICRKWRQRLPITLVECEDNYSFSYSNNRAAEIAQGSLLLFSNNDIVVPTDAISIMANRLNDPLIGAVGIRQHESSDPAIAPETATYHHIGVHLGPDVHGIDEVETTMFRPFNLKDFRLLPGAHAPTLYPPAATASFLMMHKSDFFAVGGFSEDYDYGYEDVDLCMKIHRYLDKKVAVVNDAYVLHGDAQTRHAASQSDKARRRIINDTALGRRFGYILRRHYRERLADSNVAWTGRRLRVAFAVSDTSLLTPAGDTYTAHELALALRELYDWDTRLYGPADWYRLEDVDVLVAMRDDYDLTRIEASSPGLVKVAWARNWFQRWCERPWLYDFDVIWCSGVSAAEQVRKLSGLPVSVLLIGTNADRFTPPDAGADRDLDYIFTGSYWGEERDIGRFLFPERLPFTGAVFGKGWEQHPRLKSIHRGFRPYEDLPGLYRRAKVVIDDANHVTKLSGSVNSRVFDALASGALVVTNGTIGSREVFSDRVPVFHSASDLEELLHHFLKDEVARVELVGELRREVLLRHTYRVRAQEVHDTLLGYSAQGFRVAIKTATPNRSVAHEWGDYHFALALSRALRRRGHTARVDFLNEWQRPESVHDDVVIVLRGLSFYQPRPDQINIMWNISHPDKVTQEEYELFDHVFVASTKYAGELAQRLSVSVTPLLQCTDPVLFTLDPDVAELDDVPAHSVLFIGNSRNVFRTIVKDAIAAGLDIAVYGSRWDKYISAECLKGEHIPNHRVPLFYKRAKVVLNDHWNSMATYGFISNRIFDAGASGAAVVTDEVQGILEVFGDALVTYRGADDLGQKVSALLADESKRHSLGKRLQELVLGAHTFDQRAVEILRVIRKLHALRMLGPSDPPLFTTASGGFSADIVPGSCPSEVKPAVDQ